MKMIILLLSLTSLSAQAESSLNRVIQQTNLLQWKERPVIKFKPTHIGTISCEKDKESLIVKINPKQWQALDKRSQLYEFCSVMHECEENIKCPSIRSY